MAPVPHHAIPAAASPRVWYRCRPESISAFPVRSSISASRTTMGRCAAAAHVLRPVQASAGHRDLVVRLTYGGVEQATLEQEGRRRAVESSAAIRLSGAQGASPREQAGRSGWIPRNSIRLLGCPARGRCCPCRLSRAAEIETRIWGPGTAARCVRRSSSTESRANGPGLVRGSWRTRNP